MLRSQKQAGPGTGKDTRAAMPKIDGHLSQVVRLQGRAHTSCVLVQLVRVSRTVSMPCTVLCAIPLLDNLRVSEGCPKLGFVVSSTNFFFLSTVPSLQHERFADA